MTVDVEDWYQVQAFAGIIPRREWDGLDSRVEANTERILARFAQAGVTATFFTLGWVAERHGALVRRIVAGGHELASHGHAHQRADTQSPAEFREDVERARVVLEDAGGVAVAGYRAPTFSIGPRNGWAWDVLCEAGYRYSSSLYPVRHDLYGTPDACRFPYQPSAGSDLWEIPMTAIRVRGQNLPCSGGGWFRMLPYPVFRLGLQHFTRQEQQPGVFYIHPWEVDPNQPDVPHAPWRARFRHRVNLGKTEQRLTRLLGDFRWDRMDRVFPQLQAA